MAPDGRDAVLSSVRESDVLDLVDGLVQLTFAVQAVLGRVAARFELSVTQARLLGILRDRRPTITVLAALLGLDKSSVTGLIDRAEDRGLVRRTPSTLDRRSVQVVITAAGRRLVSNALEEIEAELHALTRALSDADKTRLASLASVVVATDALA